MSKGRPRTFDTAEALDSAMHTFWQKGYRGTSLDDLTETMGINRPSLYAAFGDKEGLFIKTVNHYRQNYLYPPVKRLLEAGDLKDGLLQYFGEMTTLFGGGKNPPGCLIACLLGEDSMASELIRQALSETIAQADEVFGQLFRNHRARLADGIEPAEAAQMLITTLHGIGIRARSGASKRALLAIGESFVKMIVAN